jgi:putative ABC transport system permease protein
MIRARILAAAIGSRRGAAAVLFVVAVIAVAAATIGPMFLQSADTSVFASTASAAPIGQTDLLVVTNGGTSQLSKLTSASQAARHLADGRLAPTIFTAVAGAYFETKGQPYESDILARTGICQNLRILHGSCPTGPNEVAISERSGSTADVVVGARLPVTEPGSSITTNVTVTGIYLQPSNVNDSYWRGSFYFDYGTGTPPKVILDPLIATFATVLTTKGLAEPQLSADIPWRAGATHSGASALESTANTIKSQLFSRYSFSVTTGLPSVVRTARHDDNLMSAVVLAIVLQLILLSLVILYTLGRSAILSRRQESEFARRHGFPRSALIALAIGEPATLIVAALPVGVLVAWVTLALFTKTVFVAGTPVSFPWIAIVLAVAACVAGVSAMTIASYDLWRSRTANSRQARRVGVIVDTVAVALAVTGLLSLLTKGALNGTKANPLALLAPGLLTLGASVIGLRLAALLVKMLIARSGESTRVSWFLAVRQIGRRPTVLRRLLPLAAATAVLIFAVGSFFLASSNRSLVAHLEVGATKVVDVTLPPGLNLEAAVRKADPSGHDAMAATYYPSSAGSVLAVDTSRLAVVAYWPASLSKESLGELAKKLSPPLPPGVSFSGDELRLTLDLATGTPQIVLEVNLFDQTYPKSHTLYLTLMGGLHTYTMPISSVCPGTCRLTSLAPNWVNPANGYSKDVSLVVRGISVQKIGQWHDVAFGAGKSGTWRTQPSSVQVESPESTSVAFDIPGDQLPYGGLLLSPVDLPRRIPALITNGAETADAPPTPSPGGNIALALGGNTLTAHPVAVVPTLPLVGQSGVIMDLGVAQRALTNGDSDATSQVWLAPSASPSILQRLRAEGVEIDSVASAATRLGVLDHGGIALAYAVALIVSPIAALLALGTVTFVIVSDGRRRRREFASLSMTGVPIRTVRRAYVLENALVLGVALVIGAIIGFVTGSLALSSLPQFVAGSGGFPISKAVPIDPVLCAVAILAILLAAAVELSTRLALHGSRSRQDTGSME